MSSQTQSQPNPGFAIDPDSDQVTRILQGAIDMHCHSGPSVMPRDLTHIEAMEDAARNGLRAVLIKDHYYSVAPVVELLHKHYAHLPVRLFSGVPLNNTSGGFNRYAVDHGLKLGARIVWMPTFSACNHIEHEKKVKRFPHTRFPMLEPTPLTALDDAGKLRPEVLPILDMVAEHDAILSAGHLHISEIFPLFEEASRRGVRRLLVNHPSYLIEASLDDIGRLAQMGAYVEHSICMFVPDAFLQYTPEQLKALIDAASVGQTILGSDLGQEGKARPVRGFRSVISLCLTLGYTEDQIRQMIGGNPARLLGFDPA